MEDLSAFSAANAYHNNTIVIPLKDLITPYRKVESKTTKKV
jgi:hypothetical protein